MAGRSIITDNEVYLDVCRTQTSMDISSVVVKQMKLTYQHLTFIEGDVTAMEFEVN